MATTMIPAVFKDTMILRCHLPSATRAQASGFSDKIWKARSAAFVGDFQEVFPPSPRIRDSKKFRRFRFFCSSLRYIQLRRHDLGWSLSNSSSSDTCSALCCSSESVVATPRENGDNSVQAEDIEQQQQSLRWFCEGSEIQDWGLRLEKSHSELHERNPVCSSDGEDEKTRGLQDLSPACEQLQNETSTKGQGDQITERSSEFNECSPRDMSGLHRESLEGQGSLPENLEVWEQDHSVGSQVLVSHSVSWSGKPEPEIELGETFLETEIRSSDSPRGPQLVIHHDSAKQENSSSEEVVGDKLSDESESNVEQDFPASTTGGFETGSLEREINSKLHRELDMAGRAVQLACVLSTRTQHRVLQQVEKADEKKDRSLVTVADWGVQAVVSWVLSQTFEGEEIPMIAEEDTTGLRGMEKIDLLQRVVSAVNECLQEAGIVGISPPAHPLGAVDVLKAISKGSAAGGKKGRYWVLDPVDGTLGFVRGDQYAIALALIEDGEVVLAVLGCPNFPLRKQWLKYHHRYYRLASKVCPPSPGQWHKGLILTAIKGAGRVIMQPLVVDADGLPQLLLKQHIHRPVSVSPINDPAKATFCEPFEKANSSHSFTAGLAKSLGLRNRPLRVYSLAKYAAIARGDAEIFMKFAKTGYKEKIWDHAAGFLIVQEAGGVVTDAAGQPLDFSQGRLLKGLDRGIIACSGKSLHEKLLKAVDASWNSSTL